ncbi:MAG TPA: hypothetical protein VJT75_03730 [Thermoleophilaceae bacterium]|nr:hypothetical protein [Thermoleophilaceae bacterium]
MDIGAHTYEVTLYLTGETGGCRYAVEHRFHQRPDVETVRLLLDEAREHYRVLFDIDPTDDDITVNVMPIPVGQR